MNCLLNTVRATLIVCVFSIASATYANAAITEQQAYYAFQQMQRQSDIEYRFLYDGCYARAHLMCRRMQAMGYQPFKAWAWAKDARYPLSVGNVKWNHHVAPVLSVMTRNGVVRNWVIDPSMFNQPVDVDVWYNRMHPQNAGGAYTSAERYLINGQVPKMGIEQHAVYIMRVYRLRFARRDFRCLTGAEFDPPYMPRFGAVKVKTSSERLLCRVEAVEKMHLLAA